MPFSAHFVGNRLRTNYILRLARNSTWNCNFLSMILRNPIYSPTIFLKPVKDMQQHTLFPSCTKYLYMSRLRDTEHDHEEVQCTSNWKLTEQFK